ncbi:hypothetical protein SAMN05660479_03276 [Microbulbifer thermotolerans]|uniref:hypothetical protein n=1 Tax=Microbulbifer thermotolerans TaxID=252514 RepID=UPI0008E191BA|nr:hypothetical protein [Microbulbifer thermotolerans]SFD14339.1 hypothetical protein SAMN05660479_03276 [Microbulbifer thermotolerans]
MQIYKGNLLYFLISIVVLSLIAIYFHISWRFSQVDAGICPAEGRILSGDELRKRMLKDFVRVHVDFTDIYYRILRSGSWRVGISPDLSRVDVKRLIRESYGNEKSFEENFSIDVIAPSELVVTYKESLSIDFPKKHFSLVFFTDDKSGLARFISTKSVYEIENDDDYKKRYKISLFDRYRGFGKHFYSLKSLIIHKDCCDNKFYRQTIREYMKNKREAYRDTVEEFDRGVAFHSQVVAVSNCGNVMTEKVENGLNLDFVKWM